MTKKEYKFSFVFDQDTADQLKALKKHYQRENTSQLLRFLINRQHECLALEQLDYRRAAPLTELEEALIDADFDQEKAACILAVRAAPNKQA